MKIIKIALVATIFFVFVACNKDEDIVIDNPEFGSSLKYSVIEYMPAPGQYINENVSGFNDISTMEQACSQAKIRLQQNQYVSLGAWGGYIVVKLEESIINTGGYSFAIAGNSFDSSNEPGIVWVMQDTNKNGEPDDQWYELKGSYYGKEGYERNYWVTYYKPEAGQDTYWTDSNGDEGYVIWMGNYHNQDYYYPGWITSDSYTLHGTRLPSQAEQNPVTGIWSNLPFEWGYVDNNGSDITKLKIENKEIEANTFRISDAIDKNGNSVDLDKIDFVKVQTAINGSASILGENSTEICGFFSL